MTPIPPVLKETTMTTTETPTGTMRRAAAEMRMEGGWVWAVADWLMVTAEFIDVYPELQRGHVDGDPRDDHACHIAHAALKTARAYLGETPATTGETP